MKLLSSHRALFSLVLVSGLLAACGVNDDTPIATAPPPAPAPGPAPAPPSPPGVPTSATTSSAGAIAFVKAMAASSDETTDPVELGDAVLASSDADEPDPSV